MNDALIGYSGFVGSTLLRQRKFDLLFRSTTIQEIDGLDLDTVVCAGAPAQKWLANRNPDLDSQVIDDLISHLRTIRCKQFILVSTVDVFRSPIDVNENTRVDDSNLHPYGLNRRRLEIFVQSHFENSLIVRLPGLCGPGLRKNIIFDFKNNNNLAAIDSRDIFQFYPMACLWFDIEIALQNRLSLIHLTSAPMNVGNIAQLGFGQTFANVTERAPMNYDMKSLYSALYHGSGPYQYSDREVLLAIRHFAQSEPVTVKTGQKSQ